MNAHAGNAIREWIWLMLAATFAGCASLPAEQPRSVQRMYVFNCGEIHVTDISRWSPGVNVGQPADFSDNCYLIKHAKGLLLWDSGLADAIADKPDGVTALNGAMTMRKAKTLAAQLSEIGVAPKQITHLAFSHTHSDHVGNANLFDAATLYIQEPEYEAAFGSDAAKFNFAQANYEKLRGSPVLKLHGDHDIFGDGSVIILSTPGHTPGHQSLLVRLPKTGAVVLSGDATHFRDNWENRRVPSFNFNKEQTLASMAKLAALLEKEHAQLWINHDRSQSAGIPHAPQYVE